jgi:NarL family two-component system response regulator LiaR
MTRVLIADDHKLVRQGLRFLLDQEDGFEIVGECADGSTVLDAVGRLAVDIVLLDLLMPNVDGISVLRQLQREVPHVRVLILTSLRSDDRVHQALSAGASGYLLKTAGVEEVISTLRAVAAGGVVLDGAIASQALRRTESVIERLSARELEVLRAVGRGYSNKEISHELGIREETAKTHVSHMLAKLGLQDRTQAAIFAVREGLVPLSDEPSR